MDDKSIISKDTFEVFKHEEDCPYAFICDKRIAPIIALLNKKGYSTLLLVEVIIKMNFMSGLMKIYII